MRGLEHAEDEGGVELPRVIAETVNDEDADGAVGGANGGRRGGLSDGAEGEYELGEEETAEVFHKERAARGRGLATLRIGGEEGATGTT